MFIEKLSCILRRQFPNCYSEVHVFGSSENRLGTNSSDGTIRQPFVSHYIPVAMLITVDVCVVTTTKDMDNTCMLASILHESTNLLPMNLT